MVGKHKEHYNVKIIERLQADLQEKILKEFFEASHIKLFEEYEKKNPVQNPKEISEKKSGRNC